MFPQITPFQPDFGMVQKALGALQSRYEQGFASVKSVYNQVLNVPLSDQANRAMRNAFVQDAQNRLKDLASVDLSIPENQETAESVFAPFWEDNMLLRDADATKWYQNELQRAYGTRDSKDDKVRNQYSDVAVQYLQNGLQKLQEAGRDANKYSQLEKRRFVPFADLQGYVDDAATKAGFKIEWNSQSGPYMMTTTNGPASAPAFATFASNVLGDKFTEQFRVMGIVDKETRIRNLKRVNPELTDDAALNLLSGSIVKELKEGYTKQKDSYDKDLAKVEDLLKGYTGVLSAKQKEEAQRLLDREEQLTKLRDQTDSELQRVTDEKKASLEIAQNPDGYFTTVMKQRAVSAWANARAANQQQKAEESGVWRTQMTIDYQKAQLAQADRNYAFEREKWEWNKTHPEYQSGSSGSSGISGTGSGGRSWLDPKDVLNPEFVGKYEGFGSTDITHTGSAYERAQEKQQERWDTAHAAIFDIKTGLGSMLYSLKVTDKDAGQYMSIMEQMSRDPKFKLNETDQKLFNEVGGKLKDYTTVDAKDFVGARTALLKLAEKRILEKTVAGGPGLSDEDNVIMKTHSEATRKLEEFEAQDKEMKRLVGEEINAHPNDYATILIDRDGKKDIVTAKDIKPSFRSKYKLEIDGEEVTPEQLAEAYHAGELGTTFQGPGGYAINFRGKVYQLQGSSFDEEKQKFGDQLYNLYEDIEALVKVRGSAEAQKELREKLSKKVANFLPEYQSETGRMGVVVRYDLADKIQGAVAAAMANESSNPANREGIYVDASYSDSDKMNSAVTHLLKQGREELEKHVSSILLKTIGVNGRPSIEIVVKPASENNTLIIGGKNLTELAGKTIEIDLSRNPSGDMLSKIRYNSGYYTYGSLLNGGDYKSDAMMEAAGYKFVISADRPNNANGVIIRYTRKKFNIDTGILEEQPEEKLTYSFAEKNPDEVVHFMQDQFKRHLDENAALSKFFKDKNANPNSPLLTLQQLREERERQRVLGGN
jgi:hypothetical protein